MIYKIPKDINESLKLKKQNPNYHLLCGGSDLVLKLKNSDIEGIIDITHIKEFSYIKKEKDSIIIGSLTTINEILNNPLIAEHFELLVKVTKNFASHQIRNIASIGGNIANDSPVADLIAPLLALRAKVTLISQESKRTIPLEELFVAYKTLDMNPDELIKSFTIPIVAHQFYYKKVGVRANLNIAKLSLVVVKNDDGYFISGASLNPSIVRFKNLEKLFNNATLSDEKIHEALEDDISPSGSFRSTKEYRVKVLINMIHDAQKGFKL